MAQEPKVNARVGTQEEVKGKTLGKRWKEIF